MMSLANVESLPCSHSNSMQLAALMIVCIDFVHYLLDKGNSWNIIDYMEQAEKKFRGSKFNRLLGALKEINPPKTEE